MIRPSQAISCFLFCLTAMWSSNIHRNYPLRVLYIQQVFVLFPARYWRGSIQRYKLHRLSGGVPARSQDRGHHPHWRNRRQCWGECRRVSKTTQLCKEITHCGHPLFYLILLVISSATALHLCRYISSYKKFCLFWISSLLCPFKKSISCSEHWKPSYIWNEVRTIWKCSFLFAHSLRLALLSFCVRVRKIKSDRWDEGMIHRACPRNLQCWWAVNLFWCPHVIKSSRWWLAYVAKWLRICNWHFITSLGLYLAFCFSHMTFKLLIFQRVGLDACLCVCVRACGALELRNGLDLPSAALMHANLPLASQENNFSHSINKV